MALLKRLFKSFIYFAFLFVLLSLWKADGAFALNEGQFASYFVDNGDVFDMQLDTNLTFSGKPLLVMNPSSGTIRGENLTSSVSLGNNPGLSDPGLRIGSNRQLFFYGNIVFVNVGRYGAIRVDGNSRVFFRNSTVGFAGNTAASRGGAVLIDGSNLFFENSTVSWTGNMGSSYGGAIYSYQSTVAFTNSSASFISNSANIGAAIRNTAGHNFTFDNSRADFISNTAGSQGGAIANYRLSFTISNSTVSFISNSASSYGGAVDNEGQSIFTVADSAVGFTSNSANSGAGIYNRQSTFTFADSSVSFNSNSAQSGGAIYNSSSNFTFINSIVRFNSNSASDSINGGGGATYNRDYSLFTIANSTINFTSNKASIGGAIYNENQSTFTFTNSIVSFTSNSGSGGAIYNYDARFVFTNSTVSWTENKSGNAGGGAISNEDLSIFTITNSSASFTLNTTDFFGGAINNDKQSTFTFANSIVSFTSNSVGDGIGGALFNGAQSTFTFINSIVRFNSNYTNILGGAIGNFQSIFTFTSSTVSFISNFARDSGGGAIISAESTLTFSNSIVSFISNSAVYGGAILSSHSSIFIFTNSTVSFISNSANIAGGAVYLRGENLSFNNSSISWTGNSASNAGGALYIGVSSVSFNDSYVYFDSNISSGAPNDLYIQDSRLKINGGRVIVNSGIEGTSTSIIYVDKSVIFELRGFSDKYVGNINVINGRVKVGGIYIAGDTFLQTANSVIELTTGTQITADSTIFFSDINSKMYITNNSSTIVFHTDAVISSGGLSYGRITKTGGGVLRIGGDNRLFGGDYTQTKGLTIVDNSGRIFSGKIEIENSSITAYGTGINYGDLRLINGYAQNYASVSGAVISENNTQLQTHSKIDFKGMSGVIMYELRGVRLVGGSTDENAIKFEGVKVGVSSVPDSSLSSGKVSFHFENSVLALSKTALSNNASVKAGLSSVRDLSLSKISANISSISFGVDFTATAMTSDRLITTADSLTLFGIDQIHILNIYRGETLNISTENFISEVFPTASNAAFVSGAQYSYSESSTVYSFESHDNGLGGNLRFIRLKDKTVVTGDFDLLYCNNVTGAFGVGASSFSIGANRGYTFNRDETYNIISKANWDISATGTGDFRIEGNGDPEKRVISARRRDNLAEQSSLFNLAQSGIKFNVSQVSIIDAYRADGGAAIRMTADNIISLENVIFSKNTSVLGGAIYAEDGKINFTNASKFSENTALTNGGGAIYGQGISVDYEGSLDFSNNISLSSGGFAYFKDSANSFMLVDAVFERNTAKNGGALYIEGGNIYSLDPNNKLTFRGNIAREKGGAAYIIGAAGRSSTFDIGADNVLLAMTNNSAISGGGAIYFDGSNGSNLVLTNPNFTDNNSLLGNGGAIYAFGGAQISTLTIRARQDILFSRNLAGGNPNDIYLGTNMDLIFDSVKKTKIRLDGGIDSAAGASTIIKKGAGEVSVGSFLYYSGMLIIEQGKFHINMSSSNLGALNVIENGELSLINNYADGGKRNIVDIAGDAVITGQYALDLNFSYPEYTDRIIVHGNLKIVENISLLKTYLWGGTEYVAIGNKVMIAESDNEIIGQFSQVDGRAGRVLWLRKGKDDNDRQWQLWLEVTGIIDFRSIAMTHNQSEVAMLFNKDALWESSMVNIPNLIGDMFFDKKYDEVLKAFDQLSGAFYPSIIRSGAQNIGMDSLYARMKPKEKAESRIWGEYYFAGNYYGDFGNLNGDFNNDLQGARVGWDIRADDSNVLGIYARFGQNKYKQGPDKADGTDIEIGLYSGLLSETKLDFKWNVSLGMQSYDVKREIGFVDEDTYDGLYPQSSFNTYSLRFGIESAYNMPISKGIIKPFIGLRGGMVLSPKITETNGDEANLIIDEKNYLRAETLFGVAWKNKTDKWSPYVKVFGSYLLTGETPKSDISFQGAPEAGEMDIWGAKEGPMLAGISAGIEYDFNSDVSAYSNLTGQIGFGDNEYYGYYANIGISVRIGGEPQPKSETPKTQSPEAAIASEHIVITIPAEPPIEAAAVAVNSVSEAKERRKNAVASFKLEAATFQNGSSKLSAAAKSKIRNMANKIKAIEYNKITVEGHTDSFGKYQNNMPLSVNRAKAVMQELVNNGIPRKKLQFIGFASDIPIQSNKTPKGRQANRRVEIFVE